MFSDGYSEEVAFSRAMKGESVGEGIPGCGNSPRKSLRVQKWRTDPASGVATTGAEIGPANGATLEQSECCTWEYGLGPGREGQDLCFFPFWRTMVYHQMFVEVNSRAGPMRITGSLTCVLENLLWLPGRMKPVTHKRGMRTRQRDS